LGKRRVVPVKIPVWLLWVVSVIAEKGAIVLGKTSTLNRDKFRIMKQRNWRCDISRARKELSYEPQYDLSRGVAETVAWYKSEAWI
jgi:nucleoside-diphosphate-sugar epimerase